MAKRATLSGASNVAKISQTEIDGAVKISQSIPGLFTGDESRFIYPHARAAATIVEIGAWKGRTSALFAIAAVQGGGSVTSIDPFVDAGAHGSGSPQVWRANLNAHQLPLPRLLHLESNAAYTQWRGDIGLLFIDGDHSYQAVRDDLRLWTPHVKTLGVVAVHDMFSSSFPGIAQAVHEWWQAERDAQGAVWQCLGQRGALVLFRRRRRG